MVEYSYDPEDTDFLADERRDYFDDLELINERREPRRAEYNRARPDRTYRSEGIDAPDAVPLWWIEFRGRQALIETFSDSDDDSFGYEEELIYPTFKFFRTDIRNNHWF